MNKILESIGAAVLAIIVVGLAALLSGTILFLIWLFIPKVLPSVMR